jgi:hypothetical protein
VLPSATPTATPEPGVIGAVPASGTGPLVCPAGYVNWESRGWWTPQGESFDQYRGIDAEICWPTGGPNDPTGPKGRLAPGTTTFKLHIQLRRLHAPITFIRIGQGPDGKVNSFYQNVNLVPDAAGYGEWYINAPTVAKTAAGWNEYRLTANVEHDGEPAHDRQYQSTGLQAWTTSSGSSYRDLPWWESRGWYESTKYVNNRMYTIPPTTTVSGTYQFNWECTATGTGTVNYHVVYVDADTHAIPMVIPRKYVENTGEFDGTVSIDTTVLSNGRHKVITRCDLHVATGTTSGLTQFLINVAN